MNKSRLRRPASHLMTAAQQGMTLIEVLIAMGIIAAVALIYLSGMTTSSKAVMINQEQITGESLAKSQMEYIKRQPYDAVSPVEYAVLDLDPDLIAAGYDMKVEVQLMNPRGDSVHNDDGLQKIIITITHNGNIVFTLEGYKCFTGQ
jgi:prepilin-type N-terminal cleavage/methylation domain-containing protein